MCSLRNDKSTQKDGGKEKFQFCYLMILKEAVQEKGREIKENVIEGAQNLQEAVEKKREGV